MAITSYSELKTAIANWTHRDDLTSYLDEFIDMAEADMNRKLRMSEMEVRATTSVTDEYTVLPSAFLEMRNIQINTSPVQVLEYRTPAQLDRINAGETGNPRYYSIAGDEIQIYPVGSCTVEIDYYKQIDGLSDVTTTNFVLSDYPFAYLHGCLYYAFMFMQDRDAALLHLEKFQMVLADMNRISNRRKFSGAPLQVIPA